VYELLIPIACCAEGESPLEAACRGRIAAGIPLYLRHACDASLPAERRIDAACVLASLKDWREQWEPALRRALSETADPKLRVELEACLEIDD
jgi:hypothetical protein